MTINSFSFIAKDPMRSIILYVSPDKGVGVYTTPEADADRMILRLSCVCKAWKRMLYEERNKATTRLRAHLAHRESILLRHFPPSLVRIFNYHYIFILKLPHLVGSSSSMMSKAIDEMKHPVVRYLLKIENPGKFFRETHGIALKIQSIHTKIEATLLLFKPMVEQAPVNDIAYTWRNGNVSIQNLYQARHYANPLERHSTSSFRVRDALGKFCCCRNCPFTFYVKPQIIGALLSGQDPDFRLIGARF